MSDRANRHNEGTSSQHVSVQINLRRSISPEPPETSHDLQGLPLGSSNTKRTDVTGDALHTASQPFQSATNLGLNVGGFVLGELGYAVPSSRPANDPSQISCTTGRTSGATANQDAPLSSIPETSQAQQSHPSASCLEASSSKSSQIGPNPPVVLDPDKDEGNDLRKFTHGSDSDAASTSCNDFTRPNSKSVTSSVTGDTPVRVPGHYDPENDMILRLEAMPAGEVRFLNLVLWVWLAAAAGVLLWQFCEKLLHGRSEIIFEYFIVNVSIGSFLFLCINITLLRHLLAVRANWHKTWTPRRSKVVTLITIELLAQWVMLICFIVPNAQFLRGSCLVSRSQSIAWFVFGRWTCWNTLFLIALISAHNSNLSSAYQRSTGKIAGHGRTDLRVGRDMQPVVVADLPIFRAHWWKFILWICMECSVITTATYTSILSERQNKRLPGWGLRAQPRCYGANIVCSSGKGPVLVSSLMVVFAMVYFFLFCFFLQRALKQLRLLSNVDFKHANTLARIQMRLRLPAFAFFSVSMLLLWYVKPYSCDSVITTWLGMLPGQMSSSVLVICLAWLGSPIKCLGTGRPPLLQVWLQEFAWTKAEKAEKLAKRNASMAIQDKAQIEKEPMFCVEAMLVCLYWSLLIYDFLEDVKPSVSMEDACSLFRPPMTGYEMFWEKSLDTKCLMAWSQKNIILVFRGTASLTNVVADVQAWRTSHLPKRGSYWQRPKIHSGFDRLWRNNGLNERIISKLKDLFVTGEVDRNDHRVYVTGHSLGGALATLAAFDIRQIGKQHGREDRLTCITFGAPRTGNHCFAAEYDEMVPDSWNVINDQDLVARGGKFLWLYKRGGHRVIINRLGDLIVRPSPLEASLRILPMQGSVPQHLLTSYLESIVAVLLAQFSKQQRSVGAMTGIVEIVRHNKPLEKLILDEAGLELKEMLHMSRWGGYAPLVAQYHSKSLARSRKSASQLQRQPQQDR